MTTWSALMRDREAEAVARWRGVWLCSASERSRAPGSVADGAKPRSSDGSGKRVFKVLY